jgi:NADH-ubiquinone oxidoreductase chain 5
MQFPLIFLAFLSVFIGYLTKDLFIGLGTSFWQGSLFSFSNNNVIINNEFCFFGFKILPLIMALSGIFLCFFMYNVNLKKFFFMKLNKIFIFLYTFLNKKWFFDKLSVILLTQRVFKIGYHFLYQKIDRGLIEQFGPTGIVNLFQSTSTFFLKFHTGLIHQNLFLTIFTTILLYISFLTSNCDDNIRDVVSRLLAGEDVPFEELP